MIGVSARQKKENDCERNLKWRFSEELPWRVVQQFILDKDP